MTGADRNADFIRANKASSFFQSESVLFDRLKELKIIPDNADEKKFQMLHTRGERRSLKKVLEVVWDVYIVKKRRHKRNLKAKRKKLERKRKKKERLEKKTEKYSKKLEEAENEAQRMSAIESLNIYEDRLEGVEETLIKIEQKIEEMENQRDEDGYDASQLKYDPELSPLWNELQNLVYDGRERARERYGEYATVPASSMNNNGNNGHSGGENGREQKEQ